MKIINQIEHLRNLFKDLKFAEVIQIGMVTLRSSLDEKRYADALVCYEYIASAYFENGQFESFLVVMKDYEKLCLTYGEDHNKVVFYYLLSLLHVLGKSYEESIVATKKSIQYSHQLKRDELLVINHCNIAAILAFTNQFDQANIAMRLASYYKQNIPDLNDTIVRGGTGALFYFALTKDSEGFYKTKREFLHRFTEEQTFYPIGIILAEALLTFKLGQIQKSILLFEQAYRKLKAEHNNVFLTIIDLCIVHFQLKGQFQYTEELQYLMESTNMDLLNSANVQSTYKDVFGENIPANTFKYPNVVSKEYIIDYVERNIAQKEALYCIHWCFVTEEIEELFGVLFVEQLLFPLFERVYQHIFKYEAKVHVLLKNEGEAFIKNMSETEFFSLLTELKEKFQSTQVHSTVGVIEIPIHFGFMHSSQLPKDQTSYDQLVAFAAASLYYAKSHEQLYIES